MRLWAIIVMAILVCAVLAGCGGNVDRIKAPFTSDGYKGMSLESIRSQLEEAGFHNIQEKPQETESEFLAGSVASVKIGSNRSWNSAYAWLPNTKIVIDYYVYTGIQYLTVTADISVSGEEGKPVFTVQTNLPDGTVLAAELAGEEDDNAAYFEQREITVQGGEAKTEPFTIDGEPLTGTYRFGVVMLPAEQSEQVQEVVGAAGEALKGSLLKTEGDYTYLMTSLEYVSPVEKAGEKISEEEMKQKLEAALSSGFGDDYSISAEGYVYTVSVWQDGLAMTAALAQAGDKDAKETWNKIMYTTMQASDSLQELLIESGYDDYMVQVQVLNDQNHENTLLTAFYGLVSYNCVG